MSSLGRQTGTAPYEILRHRFGLRGQQEKTSFPSSSPNARAYTKKYYIVESSGINQRSSHVLQPGEVFRNSKLLRETSTEANASLKRSRCSKRESSGVYNTVDREFDSQAFVNSDWGRVFACSEIPCLGQRDFPSTYDKDKSRLKHFCALTGIVLPNFTRMAYERENWQGEGSTKGYESNTKSKCTKRTSCEILDRRDVTMSRINVNPRLGFESASERRKESSFYKERSAVRISDVEKCESKTGRVRDSGQKRKTPFESKIDVDRREKRTKGESGCIQNQDNEGLLWHEFRPGDYGHEQGNYPVLKSDFSSLNNWFPTTNTKRVGLLGLQSQSHVVSTGTTCAVTKTLGSRNHESSNSVRPDSSARVDMGGRPRHQQELFPLTEQLLSVSDAEKGSKAAKNEPLSAGQDRNTFISLDSTKSSFLTLMNRIRDTSRDDVISCPHCGQTFSKYSHLRNHVQMHRDTHTSPEHNATEARGQKGDAASPRNGRDANTPCRGDSAGRDDRDESKQRATSVIMFAGQKKE